jgi:hypothetical protein
MVFDEKIILECPNCHWIFEAKAPDKSHWSATLEVPQENKVAGDVIKQNHFCRNPECQKNFIIYWFDSTIYMDRL